MSGIIQTSDLTKQYASLKAVDSVNLEIKKGEIYGFLGLNGAGKTTTIRMMLGMIRPTRGDVYLFGQKIEPGTRDIWNRVGHLVEIPYSYPELTVDENLEIFRRIRKISTPGDKDEIISKLYLDQYRNVKAGNLSLGNAQRLGIAKAMMHKPDLLILDEPANGLDPEGIVQIREVLRDLAEKHKVSVFISSHILGEISILANRIGIIHKGRIVREADTEHLDRERLRALYINTDNNQGALSLLKGMNYSPEINTDMEIRISSAEALNNPQKISTLLVNNGFPPSKLVIIEEDLEHYFLRIIHSNSSKI